MKLFTRALLPVFLAIITATASAQQGQTPLPALPADIPKEATILMLLTDKNSSRTRRRLDDT